MNSTGNIVELPKRNCSSITGMFDDPFYAQLAVSEARAYKEAAPFSHIVFDNFLPENLAREISSAFSDPEDESLPWRFHNNKNTCRKFIDDERAWSPAVRAFARELQARQFLLFLEELSGIDCLLCDPYYIGGGEMVTGTDDFLKIHADFNWHHKLQAHRRLNALFYLTQEWKPEWKGNLELWDRDMTQAVAKVEPIFNRMVVFSTTDDANHGQPEPLTAPKGVFRRLFSAFYYTTRRTEAELDEPHFTLYRPEKSAYGMQLREDFRNASAQTKTKDTGSY
jgi:Rps23 Pro-64 3,4-dihydroxylase Tpa1-like proline 4-hydroxylase